MSKGITGHHADYECLHPIVIILGRVCHFIYYDLIIPFQLPTKCIRQQFAGQTTAEIILAIGNDPLEFRGCGEMESSRQFAGCINLTGGIIYSSPATDRIEILQPETDWVEHLVAARANGVRT